MVCSTFTINFRISKVVLWALFWDVLVSGFLMIVTTAGINMLIYKLFHFLCPVLANIWFWHQRVDMQEAMSHLSGLRSPVVNKGRMSPGHWLGSLPFVLQCFDTDTDWVAGRVSSP